MLSFAILSPNGAWPTTTQDNLDHYESYKTQKDFQTSFMPDVIAEVVNSHAGTEMTVEAVVVNR